MTVAHLHAGKRLKPAVFLDKDGTLVEDIPYNVDISKIRFYPEVPDALAQLAARGYLLIVVSNQPGIAHGYFDAAAVEAAGTAIWNELAKRGVPLAGFYYCPHHPEGNVKSYAVACDCRKPLAGLLLRAAREHEIDLSRSWMIGDILNDVEAGKHAGCRTILVDRGNETEWLSGPLREPDHVAPDMTDARRFIESRGIQRIARES